MDPIQRVSLDQAAPGAYFEGLGLADLVEGVSTGVVLKDIIPIYAVVGTTTLPPVCHDTQIIGATFRKNGNGILSTWTIQLFNNTTGTPAAITNAMAANIADQNAVSAIDIDMTQTLYAGYGIIQITVAGGPSAGTGSGSGSGSGSGPADLLGWLLVEKQFPQPA